MKVSVIIPTYRQPNNICRAVDSVLAQTLSDLEVIVVDDNDPNFKERKLTELAMRKYVGDSRVKYIKHEKNKGGSAARNTGWRNSSGTYIAFLDDDDEFMKDRLENMVQCLDTHDSSWGACYSAYYIKRSNGRVNKSSVRLEGDVYVRTLMRTFYIGGGSNLLIRRCIVEEINGFDESFKRNQDIEFMVRVFENYKVAFVNKDLLTIHWDERPVKRTYEFIEGVAKFYLNKMKERIDRLSPRDRHRVLAVIALERVRIAFYYKEYKEIFWLLRENNVSFIELCKYIIYLFNRVITKKSYGFYL